MKWLFFLSIPQFSCLVDYLKYKLSIDDDIEENIRFIRSQMEIGKKSHVHVVPCALINGKVCIQF